MPASGLHLRAEVKNADALIAINVKVIEDILNSLKTDVNANHKASVNKCVSSIKREVSLCLENLNIGSEQDGRGIGWGKATSNPFDRRLRAPLVRSTKSSRGRSHSPESRRRRKAGTSDAECSKEKRAWISAWKTKGYESSNPGNNRKTRAVLPTSVFTKQRASASTSTTATTTSSPPSPSAPNRPSSPSPSRLRRSGSADGPASPRGIRGMHKESAPDFDKTVHDGHGSAGAMDEVAASYDNDSVEKLLGLVHSDAFTPHINPHPLPLAIPTFTTHHSSPSSTSPSSSAIALPRYALDNTDMQQDDDSSLLHGLGATLAPARVSFFSREPDMADAYEMDSLAEMPPEAPAPHRVSFHAQGATGSVLAASRRPARRPPRPPPLLPVPSSPPASTIIAAAPTPLSPSAPTSVLGSTVQTKMPSSASTIRALLQGANSLASPDALGGRDGVFTGAGGGAYRVPSPSLYLGGSGSAGTSPALASSPELFDVSSGMRLRTSMLYASELGVSAAPS